VELARRFRNSWKIGRDHAIFEAESGRALQGFVSRVSVSYGTISQSEVQGCDGKGIRSMRFSGYLSKSPIMPDGEEWRGMGKTVPRIHGLRHLLCRSRSEEGQSLVEFALAFLVFMFLVFAIFDFGHLFFVEMDVQNAIQEAARYGSTGNHLPDPKNPGNNLSRIVSIIDTLESDAMGVQFSNIQVTSATGGSTSAGGPGDMMTVAATVNMPLMTPMIAQMFPNGQYTFTASITIMNEPFPSSQTK
jgi:Flp pilus assembly protein TadG